MMTKLGKWKYSQVKVQRCVTFQDDLSKMTKLDYFYLKINFVQTYGLDKFILAKLYMVSHFSNWKCLLNECFILVSIQLLKK
jgi:hypothetical protein